MIIVKVAIALILPLAILYVAEIVLDQTDIFPFWERALFLTSLSVGLTLNWVFLGFVIVYFLVLERIKKGYIKKFFREFHWGIGAFFVFVFVAMFGLVELVLLERAISQIQIYGMDAFR